MPLRSRLVLFVGLAAWLVAQLSIPHSSPSAHTRRFAQPTSAPVAATAKQTGTVRIAQKNPVVNERNQITLTATDQAGQPLTGVTWESDSPDIASVNPQTGVVQGVSRGFAGVTARRGADTVSTFVVVARIESGQAAKIPGDTKTDAGGRFYISNPRDSVIMQKTGFASPVNVFAGQTGVRGRLDGDRRAAQFAGPTAVSVDNTSKGGILIADTLNHAVRRISFTDQVTTILGNGSPGLTPNDATPISEVRLNAPRGIAADAGGNLFVADTSNHALYYVDFERKTATLLAGQPGTAGKADGQGRTARFNRPAGLALSADGRVLVVADEGNNVVRLVGRNGQVSTLGKASSGRGTFESLARSARPLPSPDDQASDEIPFNQPQSVGIDDLGNIYVVDATTASVVTRPLGQAPQVVALAQAGSFRQAASVHVTGTQNFVLDADAASPDEAVKVVTVGSPVVSSVSPNSARLSGGTEVVVTGKNFAPESVVSLGDREAVAVVESATRIRFTVPPQTVPGNLTLSIQTRGGIAQQVFSIVSKPLAELADGEITTVAGGVPFLGDGGRADQAALNFGALESEPGGGVTVDGFGNLLVADPKHHRIRRVDSSGIITTIAGNGREGFTGDGGPAVQASLDNPQRVALDGAGNLYVADFGNNRIRKVDAVTGLISTLAGGGGSLGDGGPANNAALSGPSDVLADASGNLLIADTFNHRVRRVDLRTGIITTIAGNGRGDFGGDNGPAVNASLNAPTAIVLDTSGNLFIADAFNLRVRRVSTSGIISTHAGNGVKGQFNQGTFSGDGGPAVAAGLSVPTGLTTDTAGNLFISDFFNLRVRRVDAKTQVIATVAGNGGFNFSGDGGPAVNAELIGPVGLAMDGAGDLFLVDSGNDRIRRVRGATGIIDTIVGGANGRFSGDGGPATRADLYLPFELALDAAGNLFIADGGNGRIRRVNAATGLIETVAGDGTACCNDDEGAPALQTSLLNAFGVAVNPTGTDLFISLRDAGLIRKVTGGLIRTVAGGGRNGLGDNGPALSGQLDSPLGLALDGSGNLYIADQSNHRVRRVDAATGNITTVAGSGATGFDNGGFGGDGGPATSARLNVPNAVAVDRSGNVYVADTLNFRVRRIDAQTKVIRTHAGGGRNETDDGIPATEAQIGTPKSLALDAAGNLFIATGDSRVRRVDARTGVITTVAGTREPGNSGDEKPAVNARFISAGGVAVDGSGNLHISDNVANTVRVVKGVAVAASSDIQPPAVSNVTLSKTTVKRKKDATVGISWTSTDNVGVVRHDLFFAADGRTFSTSVAAGLPGDMKTFTWTIPSSLPKTKTGAVQVAAADAAGNMGAGVGPKLVVK